MSGKLLKSTLDMYLLKEVYKLVNFQCVSVFFLFFANFFLFYCDRFEWKFYEWKMQVSQRTFEMESWTDINFFPNFSIFWIETSKNCLILWYSPFQTILLIFFINFWPFANILYFSLHFQIFIQFSKKFQKIRISFVLCYRR